MFVARWVDIVSGQHGINMVGFETMEQAERIMDRVYPIDQFVVVYDYITLAEPDNL